MAYVPINKLSLLGLVDSPNTKIVTLSGNGIASGTVDIYTVPTGRRAIATATGGYNPTAGTITIIPKAKIGGTYYQFTTATSATTLTQYSVSFNGFFVFEAGESFSVTTSAANLNLWARITEFDATTSLYSPRLLTMTTGANVLYTVPTGKSALITGGNYSAMGIMATFNSTGATQTYTPYNVVSGNTVGTTYQTGPALAVTTGTSGQFSTAYGGMNAGDFISINASSSTAGQFFFTTVSEI